MLQPTGVKFIGGLLLEDNVLDLKGETVGKPQLRQNGIVFNIDVVNGLEIVPVEDNHCEVE